MSILADLDGYVEHIRSKYAVPALSIAVSHDGRHTAAAKGFLNIGTGVEATPDSIFPVGSISKVFNASLIMQLVEEGKLALDQPVKASLPGFQVADARATEQITLRHLLSHTSGLVSDFASSPESPDGSDALARYVDRCCLLPSLHDRLGGVFSYSNAAYGVLGRIVEVMTGLPWRRVVEKRIFGPLKLTQSVSYPHQLVRYRAAIGHMVAGRAESRTASVTPDCSMPAFGAPIGGLVMSASDLVRFGAAHLNRGDTAWLGSQSIAEMQVPQIEMVAAALLREHHWGLGWGLSDFGHCTGFGHGGGTFGTQSFLQILPSSGAILATQVNAMSLGGAPLLQEVLSDLVCEVTGRGPADVKARPSPVSENIEGRYRCLNWEFDVSIQSGRPSAKLTIGGAAVATQDFTLERLVSGRYSSHSPSGERLDDFTFVNLSSENGDPTHLFTGYRLYPRCPSSLARDPPPGGRQLR